MENITLEVYYQFLDYSALPYPLKIKCNNDKKNSLFQKRKKLSYSKEKKCLIQKRKILLERKLSYLNKNYFTLK